MYTEIKSYSIGQIFLIPAKYSLYLSVMWINNITIVASVDILLFGRYNHVSTSYKSYNCILLHKDFI